MSVQLSVPPLYGLNMRTRLREMTTDAALWLAKPKIKVVGTPVRYQTTELAYENVAYVLWCKKLVFPIYTMASGDKCS